MTVTQMRLAQILPGDGHVHVMLAIREQDRRAKVNTSLHVVVNMLNLFSIFREGQFHYRRLFAKTIWRCFG